MEFIVAARGSVDRLEIKQASPTAQAKCRAMLLRFLGFTELSVGLKMDIYHHTTRRGTHFLLFHRPGTQGTTTAAPSTSPFSQNQDKTAKPQALGLQRTNSGVRAMGETIPSLNSPSPFSHQAQPRLSAHDQPKAASAAAAASKGAHPSGSAAARVSQPPPTTSTPTQQPTPKQPAALQRIRWNAPADATGQPSQAPASTQKPPRAPPWLRYHLPVQTFLPLSGHKPDSPRMHSCQHD